MEYLTNYADQIDNIRETIKHAVNLGEARLTSVKAPLNVKDHLYIDFKGCEIFVHASGVLGFEPTERTYQRECECCGNLIDVR